MYKRQVTPTPQPPAPGPVVPNPAPAPGREQTPGQVTPAPSPSPAPQPKPSDHETPAKPGQTKPGQSKTETPSEHSAPAKPAESAPVPVAPRTVQQLNPELRGTLSVSNNNVATAGVVNSVRINVVNREFTERLQRDGVVYAYAYIYSSPRLLKGADGSKFVTIRMENGTPQFDAQFPSGYSGKHTVLLVDEHGKQLAWTDITVVNNSDSRRDSFHLQTGSSVIAVFAVFIVLAFAAIIVRYKVAFR